MATALVRMIEDQQIVGMFVYKKPEDLFWLVDQITDPFECEFIDIQLDEYSFNQVIDSKWTKITKKFVE